MYLNIKNSLLVLCVLFMMFPKRGRLYMLPVNYGNLEAAEPGFDFTEEEMIKHKIWKNGVIPYFIDQYSFDNFLRIKIRSFLDNVNSMTGIHFVEIPRPPVDKDTRYVFFINRIGLLDCADLSSKNFTMQGVQKMVIGYDCMTNGDLSALVLTLVGVPPQHNAPNRDEHIQVFTENIIPDKAYLFEILKDTDWLFHDVDYDYNSAGHYGSHKYTANGLYTIKPSLVFNRNMGEATSLSFSDVWKIRMLYNYLIKGGGLVDKEPTCAKLFHPGDGFRKYEPDSDDEKSARPKPNKYFGIAEEQPENPNENDGNYTEKVQNNNTENVVSKENSHDTKSFTNNLIQKSAVHENNETLKLKKRLKILNNFYDRISYLSDFQTD